MPEFGGLSKRQMHCEVSVFKMLESTNKGVNYRSKDVSRLACKYKVHKLHQRCILKSPELLSCVKVEVAVLGSLS